MSDWQPIESAPSDEYVLVAHPAEGRLPVIAMKIEDGWFQPIQYHARLRPDPTHWMRWPKMPRVVQSNERSIPAND